MRQSYHQLLNINDLKNSGNDRNKIEVSVEIPVPARFRACDRSEFRRNFEPRLIEESIPECLQYHDSEDVQVTALTQLLLLVNKSSASKKRCSMIW
jgi:hypothetical protein